MELMPKYKQFKKMEVDIVYFRSIVYDHRNLLIFATVANETMEFQ